LKGLIDDKAGFQGHCNHSTRGGVVLRVCTHSQAGREKEFCIDNLLVRIHFFIVMIRWTGLAPWEFALPFPSRLTSTFLESDGHPWYKGYLKLRTRTAPGPYSRLCLGA